MATQNAFQLLMKSRKFWLAILDALIGSLSLTLTWFLAPDKVASVMTLFGLWQPCIIILIGSIAAEDIALSKAGAEMYKADADVVTAKAYEAGMAPAVPTVPCDDKPVEG